jgi:hypothetical protein
VSSVAVIGRVLATLISALVFAPSGAAKPPQVLFDDFDYRGSDQALQLRHHGWTIRTVPGWPGIRGAAWSRAGISFVGDPADRGNRLLRLTSSTDGTPAGTHQAEICQRRKFFEGTYATRVRFGDTPDSGRDGDQLVETFYALSPLRARLDPKFSELDFEYLPNGGWGVSAPSIFVTSWATAQLEPYIADNTFTSVTGSLEGWHTLVLQVTRGTLRYFLDGRLVATHGGKYYPDVPMSIAYNLWFIQGGQLVARSVRRYHEDVDWVYHRVGRVLSPQQITAEVAALRRGRVAFRDTVPPANPPLDLPCNIRRG